jgi:hypothetical protein
MRALVDLAAGQYTKFNGAWRLQREEVRNAIAQTRLGASGTARAASAGLGGFVRMFRYEIAGP